MIRSENEFIPLGSTVDDQHNSTTDGASSINPHSIDPLLNASINRSAVAPIGISSNNNNTPTTTEDVKSSTIVDHLKGADDFIPRHTFLPMIGKSHSLRSSSSSSSKKKSSSSLTIDDPNPADSPHIRNERITLDIHGGGPIEMLSSSSSNNIGGGAGRMFSDSELSHKNEDNPRLTKSNTSNTIITQSTSSIPPNIRLSVPIFNLYDIIIYFYGKAHLV